MRLVSFNETRDIIAVLLRQNTFNVGMHLDVYGSIWYDDRNYCTLHLFTNLIGLDFDSRSQEGEKAKKKKKKKKPYAPIIS